MHGASNLCPQSTVLASYNIFYPEKCIACTTSSNTLPHKLAVTLKYALLQYALQCNHAPINYVLLNKSNAFQVQNTVLSYLRL